MFKALVRTGNSSSQLFLRCSLGVVFFPQGAQELLGWYGGAGFEKTLSTFSGMGFPVWVAAVLMVTEFLGVVLLVIGYLTRIWAVALATGVAFCIFRNPLQQGFFMNWLGDPKGEGGIACHILVFGIALALLIGGGGALSVDRRIGSGDRVGRFTV